MTGGLRVGVVGGGGRAASLVGAIRADGRAALTTVHDAIPTTAEAFAQAHDLDVAASYDELLDRVDVVFLASPMPLHVPQSITALERGVHVLTEVSAAVDVAQAEDLVRAVRESSAVFGMAENYVYALHSIVIRELVRRGEFGAPYFAENEHIADLRGIASPLPDGSTHWTRRWWVGRNGNTYPTHSIGPILDWLDDRIESVSCVGTGRHTVPEFELDDVTILLGRTVGGRLVRVALSWVAARPFTPFHHFRLQGTRGAYDSGEPLRATDPVVHLEGHADAASWQPLEPWAERVLSARDLEHFRSAGALSLDHRTWQSGWQAAESLMFTEFFDAVLDGSPYRMDVHAALDATLPGVLAEQSITQNGAWVQVPNSRLFTGGIERAGA